MKKNEFTTSRVTSTAASERRKVLYVEDEDLNWDVAHLQLSSKYELIRARTDLEALNAVRSHPDLYAILMDIQLMGSTLDGIHLTKLLKGKWDPASPVPPFARNCPKVAAPILFVSAFSLSYSEVELKRVGGDALIPKPVNFVRLNLALASISAQRSLSTLKA